jgi:hypothetical protein
MKREMLLHFGVLILFLVLTILIKGWFNLGVWPFVLGGIFGTILPDVDHLIYVYLLKPQDLTSQRVAYLNEERKFTKAVEILADSRYERSMTVFHSVIFQIVILALTIYIVSSSSSLFAIGIVTAFSLHLIVDQVIDIRKVGTIQTWFRNMNIVIDKKRSTYYVAVICVVLIFVTYFM